MVNSDALILGYLSLPGADRTKRSKLKNRLYIAHIRRESVKSDPSSSVLTPYWFATGQRGEHGTLFRNLLDDRDSYSVFLDDFRTILQQASTLIKTLATVDIPSSSPTTSPSTSSPPTVDTGNDAEANQVRSEAMTKLIIILQRNLRVRYELDIAQVVKAYVSV